MLKKFILSDLLVGHKDAQYNVMDQAITCIRQEARTGDEIWGRLTSEPTWFSTFRLFSPGRP
jgi:hypothetical protein